jgi:hypothetical protein
LFGTFQKTFLVANVHKIVTDLSWPNGAKFDQSNLIKLIEESKISLKHRDYSKNKSICSDMIIDEDGNISTDAYAGVDLEKDWDLIQNVRKRHEKLAIELFDLIFPMDK